MNRILPLSALLAWGLLPAWGQAPYSPQENAPSQQQGIPDQQTGGASSSSKEQQSEKSLFGNELPLMDPSNNTVRFNGATFDLANNGLVRARFEKYLNTPPETEEENREYRRLIEKMLQESRHLRSADGVALVSIGRTLFKAAEYDQDGGQCGALASAILSALDANRSINRVERRNTELDREIAKLAKDRNRWDNYNTNRGTSSSGKGKENWKVSGSAVKNKQAIASTIKREAYLEGVKATNELANKENLLNAKIQYQALLIGMFVQRRFDHAVIGARLYRHLFRDGDAQLHLKENSDTAKLFGSSLGTTPTVTAMDSFSNNARKDVDRSIAAITLLLDQNRLGEATERMAEAFALGEFMQSVCSFPLEKKQRIARYWQCRKELLGAVNSRDYGRAEEIVALMHQLDSAFDDSLPMSYISAQKNASDLALRNAAKALAANDDARFNEEIAKAAVIWPRNPRIEESRKELEKYDQQDSVKDEFRSLFDQKNFRYIAANQKKYAVAVFSDPELYGRLETAVTTVAEIDKTIEAVREVMDKDTTFGVYMAYERLARMAAENENFAADGELQKIRNEVTLRAHRFHSALEEAARREEDREMGSALAGYMKAQAIYPASDSAREGIRRVTDVVTRAEY